MITIDDIRAGREKQTIKMMTIGESGSGKTHLSATFPKCYFLMTEPNGEDTFVYNSNLQQNIVGFDRFIPSDISQLKVVFEALDKTLSDVRGLIKEGEIETVVLDNMTFLAENRWMYIENVTPKYSKRGELDKLAMYGELGRWLYKFVLMRLLTLPCNVILNCHEKMESDEVLEKKPDKTSPVVANILGGFRDEAEGMFSLVLYLQKKKDGKAYRFFARTNKGSQRNAKSRFNLPEVIEDIGYGKIKGVLDRALTKG